MEGLIKSKPIKNNTGMSWGQTHLGNLISISKGKKHTPILNGAHRYINIEDLHRDKNPQYTNDKGVWCNPNDLIIAWDGANAGKVGVGYEGVIGSTLARLFIKNPEIDARFLFWFLESKNETIKSQRTGATIPHISGSSLKDILIPIPPLPIQKRIAEILDAADALKRKDQQLLKKYDELAQAIFIDMFGDPVKNEKGWKLKTIGEVCHYVKDGPHVSPKYTNTGIPFISVNNIIKGSIDLSNSKYISQADFEMYSQKGKPEKNDILYTKGGTTGFAKRVDVDYEFMQWVHVALLKFDKSIINPVFFEYMLNSAYCYHQSQLLTKGIANRDLVLGEMKKIIILLPPLNIQNEFALRVSLNENMKKIQEKIFLENQNLFNTLIQKAFTGELVN